MRVKSVKFNLAITSFLLIIIWAATILITNLYCKIEKEQIFLIEQGYKIELLEDRLGYTIEVDHYIFQENHILFNENQDFQEHQWRHSRN